MIEEIYEWQWTFFDIDLGRYDITQMHYTEEQSYSDWTKVEKSKRKQK